jgi:hypothetical protein
MAKTLASQARNGGSIPLARFMRSVAVGVLTATADRSARRGEPRQAAHARRPRGAAAETYAPGPVSGTLLGTAPINGITPPFPSQPVQGFSAVLDAGRGELWVMPDNGYGAEENPKDFLLRVYRIAPDFETAKGGSGTIDVRCFIGLSDPGLSGPFRRRLSRASARCPPARPGSPA